MTSSPESELPPPPGIADIEDAARRLEGLAVRTPLLDCPALSALTGGRVLIKAEMLQRTGSFKFRGAYNRISRLDMADRDGGLVAFSSGNHAQAVAAVAAMLDIKATIVMPSDAPRLKTEATRGHGAEVVLYDRYLDSREDIAAELVRERGATLIPPFEHPLIIAGQGTVGLEIADDLRDRDMIPDAVLAPCGGGGLIAGIATAIRDRFPSAAIHAVEPEGFDDTARSLADGKRKTNAPDARSICDALLVPSPGALTFSINRRLLSGGMVVSDESVLRAMAFAFRHLKLVVEPGGAVALACLLETPERWRGKTAVAVCSGGNVDAATFRDALDMESG
ncbi:MAG: threonine/serine dehydratase [Alphaproteobacteria bacterium]